MKDARERRIAKLEAILDVAKAMARQHDLTMLLELVIGHARRVVDAERATIFLWDKAKDELWSKVAHDAEEIRFPASKGIAGHVLKAKQPANIADAYADLRFNPEVDKATGFRTRGVLAVPMLSTKSEVVGVLQAVNKAADSGFDDEDVEMLLALGGQAASSIENALLYEEINALFEGFIEASVVAIESRDPTTSGHSERVAELTCGLAEAVDRSEAPPFAATRFDHDAMKAIRYASLLHDFGKVGVRESVLVKAEKLYPSEQALLAARFDFIKRTAQKEAAERKLAVLRSGGSGGIETGLSRVDAELERELAEIEETRRFILACNRPTVLEERGSGRLREIAAKTYSSFEGTLPYLAEGELRSLSVARGSLTAEDREEIERHVVHTFRFLSTIPWTRELRRVPEIAHGHHEKLDGKGYPRKVPGEGIPIEARMMAICDIFDALTASDRPYKKAVPRDGALDILSQEAGSGKVDPELLELFMEARVYERIRRPGARNKAGRAAHGR